MPKSEGCQNTIQETHLYEPTSCFHIARVLPRHPSLKGVSK